MVKELKKAFEKAESLTQSDQQELARLIISEMEQKNPVSSLAKKLSSKKRRSALTMNQIVQEVRIVRKKRAGLHV